MPLVPGFLRNLFEHTDAVNAVCLAQRKRPESEEDQNSTATPSSTLLLAVQTQKVWPLEGLETGQFALILAWFASWAGLNIFVLVYLDCTNLSNCLFVVVKVYGLGWLGLLKSGAFWKVLKDFDGFSDCDSHFWPEIKTDQGQECHPTLCCSSPQWSAHVTTTYYVNVRTFHSIAACPTFTHKTTCFLQARVLTLPWPTMPHSWHSSPQSFREL